MATELTFAFLRRLSRISAAVDWCNLPNIFAIYRVAYRIFFFPAFFGLVLKASLSCRFWKKKLAKRKTKGSRKHRRSCRELLWKCNDELTGIKIFKVFLCNNIINCFVSWKWFSFYFFIFFYSCCSFCFI